MEESRLLFRMLSFYSSAFIFPFEVDQRRGKLRKFSGWKFCLWLCLYSLAVIYYAQGLVRFLSLLMFRPEEVILLHLPAQFNAMIVPLVCHPVIIAIFWFNLDLLVKIFGEMYDLNGSSEDRRKACRKWRELPVKENLISGVVHMTSGCVILYGLTVVFLNGMSHLLRNSEQLQCFKSSKIAVLLTNLLEIWSVAVWIVKLGFLLSCNCLVLSKVESILNKLSSDLRFVCHEDLDCVVKLGYFKL